MSLGRARVVKGAFPAEAAPIPSSVDPASTVTDTNLARRIPRAVLDGRDEAARIVAEARRAADAAIARAREAAADVERTAADEARQRELARVAAEVLAVRIAEEERRARDVDRTIEMAVLLAERLVGEILRVDPTRLRALAAEALAETRGARKMRIECHPDDADEVRALLSEHAGVLVDVDATTELGRGSLVLHTELGRVDARLHPQLRRLGEALREALATAGTTSPTSPQAGTRP